MFTLDKIKLIIILALALFSITLANDTIQSEEQQDLSKRPAVKPFETPYLDTPPSGEYVPLKNATPLSSGLEVQAPDGEQTSVERAVNQSQKVRDNNQYRYEVSTGKVKSRWGQYGSFGISSTIFSGSKSINATLQESSFLSAGSSDSSTAVIQESGGNVINGSDTVSQNINMDFSPAQDFIILGYGLEDREYGIRYQIGIAFGNQADTGATLYSGTNTYNNSYIRAQDKIVKKTDSATNPTYGGEDNAGSPNNSKYYCYVPDTQIKNAVANASQNIQMSGAGSLSVELSVYKDFNAIQNDDKLKLYIGGGLMVLNNSASSVVYNSTVSAKMSDKDFYSTTDPAYNYYKVTGKDPYKDLNPEYDKEKGYYADKDGNKIDKPIFTEDSSGNKSNCFDGSYMGNEPDRIPPNPNNQPAGTPPPVPTKEDSCFYKKTCDYARDANGNQIFDANGNVLIIDINTQEPIKDTGPGALYSMKSTFEPSITNNLAPFIAAGFSYALTNDIVADFGLRATMYSFSAQTIEGEVSYTNLGTGNGEAASGITVNEKQKINLKIPAFSTITYSTVLTFRYYFK